jgi:hypothetical protein
LLLVRAKLRRAVIEICFYILRERGILGRAALELRATPQHFFLEPAPGFLNVLSST